MQIDPNDERHLECGRKACCEPADPRGWNRMTGLMYCRGCMRRIGYHLFPLSDTPMRAQTGAHGNVVRVRRHQFDPPTQENDR